MNGLEKIVGQPAIVSRLKALKDYFAGNQSLPGHILLTGSDGMGKRAIVLAFAEECGSMLKETLSRSLERKGDLTAILTSLDPRNFLLIEEIGRLRPAISEVLQHALENCRIDLVIGQGASSRIHPFILNSFTCIGTCLKETDCPGNLRNNLLLKLQLESYSTSELAQIAERIAISNHISARPNALRLIAAASDGRPRQIEVLVRQLARSGSGTIGEKEVEHGLSALGLLNALPRISTLPNSPDNLSGIEFEEFVTRLLRAMGFRTQITKATGDGGIDIVAFLDKPIVGGRYLIQCKRFAADSLVGAPTVREFYGAVSADRKACKGVLIATSGFTMQAKEFATGVGIELIDGQQLGILLSDYGRPDDD